MVFRCVIPGLGVSLVSWNVDLVCQSQLKGAVGATASGLVGWYMQGLLTAMLFTLCKNELALGGAVSP